MLKTVLDTIDILAIVVLLSRIFLTFSMSCLGSYVRELYGYIIKRDKNIKVDTRRLVLTAIAPSLFIVAFFDYIVYHFNTASILLLSFILGFLGVDLLKYIKKLGVEGVLRVIVKIINKDNKNIFDDILEDKPKKKKKKKE